MKTKQNKTRVKTSRLSMVKNRRMDIVCKMSMDY